MNVRRKRLWLDLDHVAETDMQTGVSETLGEMGRANGLSEAAGCLTVAARIYAGEEALFPAMGSGYSK